MFFTIIANINYRSMMPSKRFHWIITLHTFNSTIDCSIIQFNYRRVNLFTFLNEPNFNIWSALMISLRVLPKILLQILEELLTKLLNVYNMFSVLLSMIHQQWVSNALSDKVHWILFKHAYHHLFSPIHRIIETEYPGTAKRRKEKKEYNDLCICVPRWSSLRYRSTSN